MNLVDELLCEYLMMQLFDYFFSHQKNTYPLLYVPDEFYRNIHIIKESVALRRMRAIVYDLIHNHNEDTTIEKCFDLILNYKRNSM